VQSHPFDPSTQRSSDAEIALITPEDARIILEAWNDRNRPVDAGKVRLYSARMTANRWAYTGEPIIFSPRRLIDGQHRLLACIDSGVPIKVLVVYNAPDESFPFIDVGKARTASDIFAINGVPNYALMAATIPLVIGYEAERFDAAIRQGSTASVKVLDHEELYREFVKRPNLAESTWVSNVFKKEQLAPPSVMVAFHYLCAQKSRETADSFFRRVGDGVGFASNRDPAYKLRAKLIENQKSIATSATKLSRKAIGAMTVKAWNAVRQRRAPQLDVQAGEPFPVII
jgi:hypothetical protein